MALRPESYSTQPPNVGYYPKYHWKLITATILGAISVAVIAVVLGLIPVYIGKNDKLGTNNVKITASYDPNIPRNNDRNSNETTIEALYRNNLNTYSAVAFIGTDFFSANVTWLTLRDYKAIETLYYSQLTSQANSTIKRLLSPRFTVIVDGKLQQTCITLTNGSISCTEATGSEIVGTLTAQITNITNQTLTARNITNIAFELENLYESKLTESPMQASVSINNNTVLIAKIVWRNITSFDHETILNDVINYANTTLYEYNYIIRSSTYRVTVNGTATQNCEGTGCRPATNSSEINLENVVQATVTTTPSNSRANLPGKLNTLLDNIVKAVTGSTNSLVTGSWDEETAASGPNSKLYKLTLKLVYKAALSEQQFQQSLQTAVTTTKTTVDAQITADPTLDTEYQVKPQALADVSGSSTSSSSISGVTNCPIASGAVKCPETTTTTTTTTSTTTTSTTTTNAAPETTINLANVAQATVKNPPKNSRADLPDKLKALLEAIIKEVTDSTISTVTGSWIEDTTANLQDSKLYKLTLKLVYKDALNEQQIQTNLQTAVTTTTTTVEAQINADPTLDTEFQVKPQALAEVSGSSTSSSSISGVADCPIENGVVKCPETTTTTTTTTSTTTTSTTTTTAPTVK